MNTYSFLGHADYVTGTSLQGYVNASYDELVSVFGHPTYADTSGDDKVDIEWILKFRDRDFNRDVVATVYNWKDYDGGYTARHAGKYRWHIGGNSISSVSAVLDRMAF